MREIERRSEVFESAWFGSSWGAPVCKPDNRVDTPVGIHCEHCDEAFIAGDRGFAIATLVVSGSMRKSYFHHACWLRKILGSVGHQMRQCSCQGGAEEDPPGLTLRQAAVAALAYFETTTAPALRLREKAALN